MSWLQAIIFGIVSGISEFLPISSSVHQWIFARLFGAGEYDPVRNLVIHIAGLAALVLNSKSLLETIRRERRMASKGARVYNRYYRGNMDFRLVKSAVICAILTYLILLYVIPKEFPIPVVVCLLLVNGIVLYLPSRMLQGNKDARSMSGFDSFLIGLFGATSVLMGISRIGMNTSVAALRGADRTHAVNWALLISIPMLILMILLDVVSILTVGQMSVLMSFWGYILIASFAFIGAYIAISTLKFLSVKAGFTAFSYYSWGVALFVFILYLI